MNDMIVYGLSLASVYTLAFGLAFAVWIDRASGLKVVGVSALLSMAQLVGLGYHAYQQHDRVLMGVMAMLIASWVFAGVEFVRAHYRIAKDEGKA